MSNIVYLSYIYLEPDNSNPFQSVVHNALWSTLTRHFLNWKGFKERYSESDLGLIVAMKDAVEHLTVKGPTIIRGSRAVDFTIFLPNRISEGDPSRKSDVEDYVRLIVEGVGEALGDCDLSKLEFEEIIQETIDEVFHGSDESH